MKKPTLDDLLDGAAVGVYAIPRNDLDAATAYYETRGSITGDDLAVLLQLQDDPAELAKIAGAWTVTATKKG